MKIVKLKQHGLFAISVVDHGIKILQIYKKSSSGFHLNVLDSTFMPDQTISDMFEYESGKLLVVNYYDCSYHSVNIRDNTEELLCTGFSSRGINVEPSPYFDFEDFPYVLAKENRWLCILHLRHKKCYKLTLCEDKCAGGQRTVFLPRKVVKDEK